MKGTPTCLLCIYFLVGRKLVNMEEIWKDVKGYEGLYQVSNLGRIKNKKDYIIKPELNKNGYKYMPLYKNNKRRRELLHRIVATAFIKNTNNLPQVNHIDGNKSNNKVDNLEWCSCSYNLKEAYRLKLREIVRPMLGKKGALCPNSKKINQYDLNGNFIKLWHSTMDIERELKIDHSSISSCCKYERYKTAGGYIWRYAEEDCDVKSRG